MYARSSAPGTTVLLATRMIIPPACGAAPRRSQVQRQQRHLSSRRCCTQHACVPQWGGCLLWWLLQRQSKDVPWQRARQGQHRVHPEPQGHLWQISSLERGDGCAGQGQRLRALRQVRQGRVQHQHAALVLELSTHTAAPGAPPHLSHYLLEPVLTAACDQPDSTSMGVRCSSLFILSVGKSLLLLVKAWWRLACR